MDLANGKLASRGVPTQAEANSISEVVNLYLKNVMDIFAKAAKQTINKVVGEKIKAINKTSYKNTSDDQ